MDPAQHGSGVALLVSLGGLVLELWGGFLLGREDLFKVRERKQLQQKMEVIGDPALKGIPWLEHGGVLVFEGGKLEDLKKRLEDIPLKYNQRAARRGFMLLFAGIVVHGIERVLAYSGVSGF